MTNTSERQTVLQSTAGFHRVKISKRNSGAFKPGPDICLQRDPVGQLLTDKRTFIKHARFCLMQAEVVIVIKKKEKTFGNQKYKSCSEIWRGGIQRCEVRVGKRNFLQQDISSETMEL